MLDSERIGPQVEAGPVQFYRMLGFVELFHHPLQGNIGKPRLVFWMATPNVRVVAGKPDLAKPGRIEVMLST